MVLFAGQPLMGQQPVQLGEEQEVDLSEQAYICESATDIFNLQELRKREDSLHFRTLKDSYENLGFSKGHLWIRFELIYEGAKHQQYFLQTARPITDLVKLYQIAADGSVKVMRTGDRLPWEKRQTPSRNSILSLEMEPGQHYRYYLHLFSDGEMVDLPLKLRKPAAQAYYDAGTEMLFGIFYGFVLLAALVYFLFYLGMRDRSLLFFSLFVLSLGLFQFSLAGYVLPVIDPEAGFIAKYAVLFTAYLSILLLGKYSESFLQFREHLPLLRWLFKAVYILGALFLLLALSSATGRAASYPLIYGLGLVLLFTIFGAVIALRRQGQPVDPFYTLGISFLVLTLVVFILNNIGLVPNNFLTVHSFKIGAGMEILFLSISMSNRIRRLKSDKEKSQAQALEKSEQMNDVKNYFMSNMRHELRTPLNAILGMANDMRERDKLPPSYDKDLDVIRFSSKSLLSSVNDILDFSKIEKNQLELRYQPLDPKEVIEAISNNWRSQAEEKGLDYQLEWDSSIPARLEGDADRLGQIVNNLLGNAVKFTSEGSIFLAVHASQRAQNDGLIDLCITVRDTGVGIEEDKQKQVFESFWQQSLNHKRKFGGLGLGLSIVRELVKLHQGIIRLESMPGKGTTFEVMLPLKVLRERKKTGQNIDLENKDLGGSSLLIVEDNVLNQMVLKKMLDGWEGTEYEVAENGQVALEQMSEQAFDLILMDLQMPVMDGYEATTEIRKGAAGERHAQIPIVAVTADTMDKTRHGVEEMGIEGYLTKPVSNDDLYRTVALLIAQGHSARPE